MNMIKPLKTLTSKALMSKALIMSTMFFGLGFASDASARDRHHYRHGGHYAE